MKVDANFDFAEIADVSVIKVVIGQRFSLSHDFIGEVEWTASHDEVLLIKGDGKEVDIEATNLGKSTVLIADPLLLIDDKNYILKRLVIEVVRSINQAVTLGISIRTI